VVSGLGTKNKASIAAQDSMQLFPGSLGTHAPVLPRPNNPPLLDIGGNFGYLQVLNRSAARLGASFQRLSWLILEWTHDASSSAPWSSTPA
jgi:hypothetical protein